MPVKEGGDMASVTKEKVADLLRQVIDPEVGINIVDLGLIYEVLATDTSLHVKMTMTSPACPLGPYLTDEVRTALRQGLPDLNDVDISLVWEPPWSPERMSDAAKSRLGWQDEPKEKML